jgi:hypothetical protein
VIDRPTFIIELRPEPGVDGMLALRAALKILWRQHGLRCVAIRSEPPLLEQSGQSDIANQIVAHGE